MNQYETLKKELEEKKCSKCGGLGNCDDAALGDIYFNRWTCEACKGTGIEIKNVERGGGVPIR
jgi:DnaJ-class molecular chaperone